MNPFRTVDNLDRAFRVHHPNLAVAFDVLLFAAAAGSLLEWPPLGTWLLILWPPFWHAPAAARSVMLLIFAAASIWSIATIPHPED